MHPLLDIQRTGMSGLYLFKIWVLKMCSCVQLGWGIHLEGRWLSWGRDMWQSILVFKVHGTPTWSSQSLIHKLKISEAYVVSAQIFKVQFTSLNRVTSDMDLFLLCWIFNVIFLLVLNLTEIAGNITYYIYNGLENSGSAVKVALSSY